MDMELSSAWYKQGSVLVDPEGRIEYSASGKYLTFRCPYGLYRSCTAGEPLLSLRVSRVYTTDILLWEIRVTNNE